MSVNSSLLREKFTASSSLLRTKTTTNGRPVDDSLDEELRELQHVLTPKRPAFRFGKAADAAGPPPSFAGLGAKQPPASAADGKHEKTAGAVNSSGSGKVNGNGTAPQPQSQSQSQPQWSPQDTLHLLQLFEKEWDATLLIGSDKAERCDKAMREARHRVRCYGQEAVASAAGGCRRHIFLPRLTAPYTAATRLPPACNPLATCLQPSSSNHNPTPSPFRSSTRTSRTARGGQQRRRTFTTTVRATSSTSSTSGKRLSSRSLTWRATWRMPLARSSPT